MKSTGQYDKDLIVSVPLSVLHYDYTLTLIMLKVDQLHEWVNKEGEKKDIS